jgi:hypothetical protein
MFLLFAFQLSWHGGDSQTNLGSLAIQDIATEADPKQREDGMTE